MNDREDLLRKLRSIRELCDRGVDGEKVTANKLLNSLLEKYGLSLSDLVDDEEDVYYVRYKDPYERKLICQIVYTVTGQECRGVGGVSGRSLKEVAYITTAAKHIEIQEMYEFYLRAFHQDLDTFYLAFLHKNNLFPPEDLVHRKSESEASLEELEAQNKALRMAIGMERHDRRKALPSEAK